MAEAVRNLPPFTEGGVDCALCTKKGVYLRLAVEPMKGARRELMEDLV